MTNDPSAIDDRELRHALWEADATSPEPAISVDAATLMTAARRRRADHRRRRAAAAASFVLAALLLRGSTIKEPVAPARASNRADQPALASATGSSSEPSASAASMDQLREKLARLEREADLHQRIVHGLRRAERLAAQKAELVAAIQHAPPPALAAQEAARAAAISLQYATIVESEDDFPRARREYRRVARRFPGTTWAALAAASLDRLPAAAGDRPSL